MFNFTKRTVVAATCSLALLAFTRSEVRAQGFGSANSVAMNSLQRRNAFRAFGQALGTMSPLATGFNPFAPAVGFGTPGFGLGPGLLANNPYTAALSSVGFAGSPYANPYAGGYGGGGYGWWWYEDPYGAQLRGAAEVIKAQGTFAQDQQKAVLTREQIQSERLANRRKLVEEYLFERDKLPTSQDERERTQAQELRRSLTDPPVTEIWSAKALNDLLAELQKQAGKGVLTTVRGPKEVLDPDMLKLINVTSAKRGGNVGLLKNGGRLNWPLALTGPEFKEERERLASLLQDAVREAEFNNRIDAGSLKQMVDDLGRMERQLRQNVGDLPPSDYTEAKRFLSDLGDALRVMGRPDGASYLNRKYTAKGKTVLDLVKYMTDNGLQFASAVAGDEAAYVALHRALAAYTQGLQHADGQRP
jgi:hypothetical protein